MKKQIINTSLILFVLLSTIRCATTDMDRSVDFNQYKTFTWGKSTVSVQNPSYRGGLIDKQIKNTVESEFSKKGIVYNKKNPDFVVSYQTYTENKQQSTAGNYPYPYYYPYRFAPFGYGWGWGMPYAWGGGYPSRMYTYTEGTLIIDITDRKTNELVWRGSVKGELTNIANVRKQIEKGVHAILKKYPGAPIEPGHFQNGKETVSE